MNRQRLILAALVLLLAVALAYSFFRMPRQKTVDKLTYTPGMPAKSLRSISTAVSAENRLRLDILDQEEHRFAGYRRNLFKPIFHDEEKALRLPPAPPPPPPLPPAKVVAPPPAVVVPPQPSEPAVVRDMAKFTFLGFLKKDNKKTIFLSSEKEIFLVKKGDRIAGKYEVANITDDALTISMLADGGEIIIPLVENRALSAPRR